jgi:predicted RNA polymerase sigma factor
LAAEVEDDLLRLIIYCCHPVLSQNAQLALTLRLACGLSVEEIGAALLTAPAAIAQRILRAKRELREQRVAFELPEASELAQTRLPSVLQAIYLLFNAGYLSVHHQQWLRPALCSDALRLSFWLASHPVTARTEAHALAALLSFSAARLAARKDAEGAPVRLLAQDRSQWDAGLIARGFRHLDAAVGGEVVSRYHIEAAIAATHAQASSIETTDWSAILTHYDQLCAHYPSPMATLNRIIASSHCATSTGRKPRSMHSRRPRSCSRCRIPSSTTPRWEIYIKRSVMAHAPAPLSIRLRR